MKTESISLWSPGWRKHSVRQTRRRRSGRYPDGVALCVKGHLAFRVECVRHADGIRERISGEQAADGKWLLFILGQKMFSVTAFFGCFVDEQFVIAGNAEFLCKLFRNLTSPLPYSRPIQINGCFVFILSAIKLPSFRDIIFCF